MDTVTAVAPPAPSPWRTMWLSPRVTIRRILDSEVRPGWTTVVVLATLSVAISSLQVDETGTLSASRSAMPVLMSGLQLIFGVLVGPFLIAIVGGWLGGQADPSDLRHAVAWSYVPVAATSLLWIPILLTMGTGAFGGGAEPLVGLEWLGAALAAVVGFSYIWTVPLVIGGVAAAQGFSVAKAILNLAILTIPLFILMAIG